MDSREISTRPVRCWYVVSVPQVHKGSVNSHLYRHSLSSFAAVPVFERPQWKKILEFTEMLDKNNKVTQSKDKVSDFTSQPVSLDGVL